MIATESLSTYLTQRILEPRDLTVPDSLVGYYATDTARSLEPQERARLNDLIHLDYMGSSEFEWGAVPKTLRKLAKASRYEVVHGQLTGLPAKYDLGNPDAWLTEAGNPRQADFWIYAPAEHRDMVRMLVHEMLEPKPGAHKERPCVREGLFGLLKTNYRKDKRTVRKSDPARWEQSNIAAWLVMSGEPWLVCRNKQHLNAILSLLGHSPVA